MINNNKYLYHELGAGGSKKVCYKPLLCTVQGLSAIFRQDHLIGKGMHFTY